MVQPIFGSLSLILDLRFSTMFKCSAYLSKIASLSGRRVLGNGVAPELFEGVNIGFLSTRFPYSYALSVYERLIFFCFLSPGFFHSQEFCRSFILLSHIPNFPCCECPS